MLGVLQVNIADFQNGSQLTYWLAIGSNSLLFAFSIASKTAIFSAEDSLTGKYATLVSHKMAVLGHNFSFSQMNISMDVRPKVYARTSIEFMVWNVVLIWLKTAEMSGKLRKYLFFPFPDCIFKRNIFKYQYVRYNNVLVTFLKERIVR